MGGGEPCTHLELAVIFVAFTVVTTLFSLVSLGAGAMGPAPAVDVYPVLAAGEPQLEVAGGVYGSSSVPGPSETSIDTLTFRVAHTGEEGAIDLSRATVTIMMDDYIEILALSKDPIPEPGMWAVVSPGEGMLIHPGQERIISLRLDRPIPAGEILTLQVRTEGRAPCSVTGPVSIPTAGAPASFSSGKD
ncbi:MAG: hypothetical protein GX186_08920 [Methanoculleus thermophilus]|nr:hypothetical protein [Methanoculleus thermophilus]